MSLFPATIDLGNTGIQQGKFVRSLENIMDNMVDTPTSIIKMKFNLQRQTYQIPAKRLIIMIKHLFDPAHNIKDYSSQRQNRIQLNAKQPRKRSNHASSVTHLHPLHHI